MNVKPSDVELLLNLLRIASETKAAIDSIRSNQPDVYKHVAEHHAGSLAAAKRELEG